MDQNEKKLLNVKDIAKRIGCCNRVAREIIKREIEHVRIGRDRLRGDIRVEVVDFERWLTGKKANQIKTD